VETTLNLLLRLAQVNYKMLEAYNKRVNLKYHARTALHCIIDAVSNMDYLISEGEYNDIQKALLRTIRRIVSEQSVAYQHFVRQYQVFTETNVDMLEVQEPIDTRVEIVPAMDGPAAEGDTEMPVPASTPLFCGWCGCRLTDCLCPKRIGV